MSSSSTAIERSLKNIRSELEFLRDEKFLRPEQYQEIANVLSTLPAQSNNTQSRPAAEAPQDAKPTNKTVVAMYDWQGHEASDMSLQKGDKIEVTEELNKDWWRGKSNNKEGVFPANFVSENPQFTAEKDRQQGEYIAPPSQFDEKQNYQPPPNYYGAQQNQQVQQQSYYGAPQQQQQQYYQPQQQNNSQPQFVQQAEGQQQQQHHGGGNLKKFGSKFGNAAIWGAGATLGSDLINSIF